MAIFIFQIIFVLSLKKCKTSVSLVTIILTAFNSEKYIETSIQSVLKQTFRDWNLIITDDCSSDKTLKIAKRYAENNSKISILEIPINSGGPARPRNLGVSISLSPWVGFLDADDVWHPQKLEFQLDVLSKTRYRFCSTLMIDFVNNQDLSIKTYKDYKLKKVSFLSQLIKFKTPTSSVVAARELLIKYPFNESPSFVAREDMVCWLSCHDQEKETIKIMSPLVFYRKTNNQISRYKIIMMKKHFMALNNYKFKNNKMPRILLALIFTFTHIIFSIYNRQVRRRL